MQTGVGVDCARSAPETTPTGGPWCPACGWTTASILEADTVIAATGRRGPVVEWLAALDVDVPETTVESGLIYLTRWYARPAAALPPDPKLGGDLGFVKYLAVPGDGDTLSVTLAVPRRRPRAPPGARSTRIGSTSPATSCPGPTCSSARRAAPRADRAASVRWAACSTGSAASPTTTASPWSSGSTPSATPTRPPTRCTAAAARWPRCRPCLLADAFAAHPDDPVARAAAYEAGNAREVEPWYESAVQMDQLGADPAGTRAFGGGGGDPDAGKAMAAVFVAAATDPIIGRGIARFMNLLRTPAQLLSDPELMVRIAEVVADPDAYPVPPRVGPGRRELHGPSRRPRRLMTTDWSPPA